MGVVGRARARANEAWVRQRVRRADRRVRRHRMLLVPRNWGGSVQTFYHFLLGYFLPVTLWLEHARMRHIVLRDCGPMNCWFDLLPPDVEVEVVQPGVALAAVTGKWMRYRAIRGLDDPEHFDARRLRSARAAVLTRIGERGQVTPNRVVVVDRGSSDAFHRGPGSETEMSGSERRSTPNLAAVVRSLPFTVPVDVVDTAVLAPVEQIRVIRDCRVLVGQHGAGLAHMLWLEPGATVVEIQPPVPDEALDLFARLAATLGHGYVRVTQESVHAPVEPDLLRAALACLEVLDPSR